MHDQTGKEASSERNPTSTTSAITVVPADVNLPYEPPKRNRSDTASDIVGAVAKALPLPFVGEAATELLSSLVGPTIDRRRQEWMQEVAAGLRSLEARGLVDIEQLVGDERFATALLQATVAALATHREEKRIAFRNTIFNTAAGRVGSNDGFWDFMYYYLLRITDSHIKILKWAQGISGEYLSTLFPAEKGLPTLESVLCEVTPELQSEPGLTKVIWSELQSMGFLGGGEGGEGFLSSAGKAFIEFVEAP